MEEIWTLCNCTKKEWENLTSRARYDRKARRGLNNPKGIDYTPTLSKETLQQYIDDIVLDSNGDVAYVRMVNGKIAKPYVSQGYQVICIENRARMLHRVLYAWFIGPIPKNMVVDHIDENKLNNKLSNLQLLTRKENIHKSPNYDPSKRLYK